MEVGTYEYSAARKNNPEVGLVTPDTDPEAGKTTWAFDPQLAPELKFDSQGIRQQVETLLAEITTLQLSNENLHPPRKQTTGNRIIRSVWTGWLTADVSTWPRIVFVSGDSWMTFQ